MSEMEDKIIDTCLSMITLATSSSWKYIGDQSWKDTSKIDEGGEVVRIRLDDTIDVIKGQIENIQQVRGIKRT